MEKIINLPALPENGLISGSQRLSFLEYSFQGKILKDEEVKDILNKWIAYICGLVPATVIHSESYTERLESSKVSAQSSKNSLVNAYRIIHGSDDKFLAEALKRMDETIANASDDNSVLHVHMFESTWEIKLDDTTCIISGVDFCFRDGKEFCKAWEYDKDGNNMDAVYVDSWEDGVKLYILLGNKWLTDFAPEMNIPQK